MFRRKLICFAAITLCAGVFLCIVTDKPDLYEKYHFSSAVYDRNGKLLKLSLTMDDKYRLFVKYDQIPKEAVQALLLYEDRYFFYHFGINPLSVIRAVSAMLSGQRRLGASTITMQLARLVYHIDSSNSSGKFLQMLRAMQIELFYSKKKILEAYFNLAPYGGNIEGIGAASQIYFDVLPQNLKLEQILALSVIPQNPGKRSLLVNNGRQNIYDATRRLKDIWLEAYPDHPDRQRLENIWPETGCPLEKGKAGESVSSQKYMPQNDDCLDFLPQKRLFLPNEAPHFTRRVLKDHSGDIQTVLDLDFQHMVEETVYHYVMEHQAQGIKNAAVIVLDASTMETLAYVGSADFRNKEIHGQVDGIEALRSPGSALKPFIYAMALEKGIIHPLSMLKDVPRKYGVYTPENFDHAFYGLLDATQALVYSRNIPAVDLLQRVGEKDFYQFLVSCEVKKLRSPDEYGLSMALGGVEVSVQNLAQMYAMLYREGQYASIRLTKTDPETNRRLISPEAAFLIMDMLSKNIATDQPSIAFSVQKNNYPVSWKTGTSYGYKDAWSAGIVGSYVIVVWVGNFDGTPNQAFEGRKTAAPLFFRLVRKIAKQHAFPTHIEPSPHLNLEQVPVCQDTGELANAYCAHTKMSYFIPGISRIKLSETARLIPINVQTGMRACRHKPPETILKQYNFWPSDVLRAYQIAGVQIKRPPDFGENCDQIDLNARGSAPRILRPVDQSRFMFRSENDDHTIALQASLDADSSNVYWFLNNHLVGRAKAEEIMTLKLPIGNFELKAADDFGRTSVVHITSSYID